MRWRLAVLLALPFIGVNPALSQDCENPQMQTDMNICAGVKYKQSDAALNQAYSQLMERLSGDKDGQSLLREAQRAWIAFRDAECGFVTGGSRDGSIYPMLMAGCLMDLTDRRVKDLKELFDCQQEEGAACAYP